jgi:hypothetical protein
MSRSEHATRRDPRDLDDLRRKRRIKELVAAERVHPGDVPTAQVPVRARPLGPRVHYPASLDDVRAVLARVPVAAGIAAIELCVEESDVERMAGVHCGEVLGRYYCDGPRVHVHGFTYDPAHPCVRSSSRSCGSRCYRRSSTSSATTTIA